MRCGLAPLLVASVLTAALSTCACASKPAPPPPPPSAPSEVEELVSSLTKAFSLDAAQQEKTRQFARELIERNTAIRASWDRGEPVRPETLLASRGQFESQFTSILTNEQRRKYQEELLRLRTRTRSVQPRF
jgi:hypothetical protein